MLLALGARHTMPGSPCRLVAIASDAEQTLAPALSSKVSSCEQLLQWAPSVQPACEVPLQTGHMGLSPEVPIKSGTRGKGAPREAYLHTCPGCCLCAVMTAVLGGKSSIVHGVLINKEGPPATSCCLGPLLPAGDLSFVAFMGLSRRILATRACTTPLKHRVTTRSPSHDATAFQHMAERWKATPARPKLTG